MVITCLVAGAGPLSARLQLSGAFESGVLAQPVKDKNKTTINAFRFTPIL